MYGAGPRKIDIFDFAMPRARSSGVAMLNIQETEPFRNLANPRDIFLFLSGYRQIIPKLLSREPVHLSPSSMDNVDIQGLNT